MINSYLCAFLIIATLRRSLSHCFYAAPHAGYLACKDSLLQVVSVSVLTAAHWQEREFCNTKLKSQWIMGKKRCLDNRFDAVS